MIEIVKNLYVISKTLLLVQWHLNNPTIMNIKFGARAFKHDACYGSGSTRDRYGSVYATLMPVLFHHNVPLVENHRFIQIKN
jgi:hypothetical protein